MKILETRAAFARRLGVHRSHITRAMQAGRLVMQDGLVDVEASQARMALTESPMPHHEANRLRIADDKTAQNDAGEAIASESPSSPGQAVSAQPPAETESAGLRLRMASAKEREAKAEIAAMERDKMAGLLVERSEVEFVLRDFGNTLRSLLEALPDRLAPVLAAQRGDVPALRTSLQDAMRSLQDEMTALMQRSMRAP
jgi:hypothetical protein